MTRRGTTMNQARLWMSTLLLTVVLTALSFVTGCGGGSTAVSPTLNSTVSATPTPSPTFNSAYTNGLYNGATVYYGPDLNTPVANPITRDTEFTVSYDAKWLAVQHAPGVFASLDEARAFDVDLAAIRAAYPVVKDFHAGTRFNPKMLVVRVDKNAPYLAKWRDSLNGEASLHGEPVDMMTGEPKLDALIKKYDVVGCGGGSFIDNPTTVYLRLGASLNTRLAATEFIGSSPYIPGASAGYEDGFDTYLDFRSDASKATRIYTFSQPVPGNLTGGVNTGLTYGRIYTIHANGSITEETFGTWPQ